MAYLRSVPVATPSWLPKPRSGNRFKITWWLEPSEYFLLMQQASGIEPGKLSLSKWLKKAIGIIDATKKAAKIDGRVAGPVVRHIVEDQRMAAAARRRRQPRKVAA